MRDTFKGKLTGALGGSAGSLGLAGSAHNICHAACQGVIAFLAVFGIYIIGEGPLMWLQKYNIYFWSMAFAFLFIGLYMYKRKCISDKIVMFNSGLVIAGLPFASVAGFEIILYTVGGLFVALSIGLFIKDRLSTKTNQENFQFSGPTKQTSFGTKTEKCCEDGK